MNPMNVLIMKSIQYTLANPNRGVPIKNKFVPISELVRISEVMHLYAEVPDGLNRELRNTGLTTEPISM